MDQYLNLSKITDNIGVHIKATSNGVNARIHFVDRPSPVDALTNEVDALKNSMILFGDKATQLMETLSEKGWKAKAKGELSQVAATFQALRAATLQRQKELAKRKEDWLLPLAPLEPMRAFEIRQWMRSLKPADVVQFALKDGEIASAVLDLKTMSGLSNDLIVHIENSLIKKNLVKRYQIHSQLKPTPDNILASGIDAEEVNKIADQAIENYELALAEIENVTGILNNTVTFYQIASLTSRDEAFQIIMG